MLPKTVLLRKLATHYASRAEVVSDIQAGYVAHEMDAANDLCRYMLRSFAVVLKRTAAQEVLQTSRPRSVAGKWRGHMGDYSTLSRSALEDEARCEGISPHLLKRLY